MYPPFLRLGRRAALLGLGATALTLASAHAQLRPAASAWSDETAGRLAVAASTYATWLHHYRPVTLDVTSLRPLLASAPMENTAAVQRGAGTVLTLPLPDGTSGRFRIVESPVMAPELAAQFPQIKTYAGYGLDDPSAALRCDLTPLGFHAQIFSARTGTVYIDPVSLTDTQHYVSFFKRDMNRSARAETAACGFRDEDHAEDIAQARAFGEATNAAATANRVAISSGATYRTFRLALAANREYVLARGGNATTALASMTTTMNRVNGVYEKEFGVRMVMVPNTNLLITTVANVYANGSGSTMLGQNQTRCDMIIGAANYDIGHVFSTGGGGVAGYAVVCNNGNKARGVTGSPNPTGDAFDIDYVAHEMGHQFSGSHSFNGNSANGSCGGNRSTNKAWEPGSGSTIMAYAGICANNENIQNNSDDYFHGGNYATEMMAFINARTCDVEAPTGNTPPGVTLPLGGVTIPKGTPFKLTATGTDADGDALSYCWEEMDLGPGGAVITPTATQTANSTPPLFRSWDPTPNPTRYFPRLSTVFGGPAAIGEALPSVTRGLKFRCTVRDQHVSASLGFIVGGVINSGDLNFSASSTAGPFTVTAPTGAGTTVFIGTATTVTWNVANTDAAPISCSAVDILVTGNAGASWDTLAANVPNTGSATFTVPAGITPSTTSRVMVAARGNFFFNVSPQNFTIALPPTPTFALASTGANSQTLCPNATGNYALSVSSVASFADTTTLTLTGLPAGVTTNFPTAPVTTYPATIPFTVTTGAAVTPGTYTLTVTAASGTLTPQTQTLTLVVAAPLTVAPALSLPANNATGVVPGPTFTWASVPGATSYTLEVSTSAAFTTLLFSVPNLTGLSTPATQALPAGTYFWRVRATNSCGDGPNSAPFSFQTVQTVTIQVPSSGAVTLPGTSAGVRTSTVVVNTCDPIADVNVRNLRINYPNAGDLFINLVGSGTGAPSPALMSGKCPGSANINLSFDQQAAVTYQNIPCPPTSMLTYQPQNSLSQFNGRPANGTWTLQVTDNTNTGGGAIQNWVLELSVIPTMPAAATAVAMPLNGNTLTSIRFTWVDNACNETAQVIERAPGGTTNFVAIDTVATNVVTYTDAGLPSDSAFCYRIVAVNGPMTAAPSAAGCFRTKRPVVIGFAEDAALEGALAVVPNPSTGEYALTLTVDPATSAALTVTDALGRTVAHTTLRANGAGQLRHALDLRGQAEGVYALRLTLADGRTTVRRLIKL